MVITGAGAVTPLGNDAETTFQGLCEGRNGIGPLTTFDPMGFAVRIAGEVRDFELRAGAAERLGAARLSRAGRFGVAAAAEALDRVGAGKDVYPESERGVAMGASVGRPDLYHLVETHQLRVDSGRADAFLPRSPRSVLRDNQNLPLSTMARLMSATGPMIGVSTACSGSGHAIGEAFRGIQEGDARFMLAGGYDSLTSWIDVLGFSLLGAMTEQHNDEPEKASRPFDANRSGFVVGEGAVVFALEELESARERGARILAEILGYGSTLNAWRITDSPPDGSGAIQAMEAAVAESGLGAESIDYVVAHGTGTHGNDLSETVAIKKVFGRHAHRLVVSSPKSMTGHLTSAGAALNVLAGVGAIESSVVPPTRNLDTPDRRLDLDYVPRTARRMPVGAVLVNAFAFGGSNTSLVIGAYQERT
ncbi:3-oxoacyl-ACP synthase [Streptomyces albireticuli]|uniref:3-oxoacyl-ACP synthase n=1 Tax=Streptomyces albireticuli TaxID=1940 RepID=A0A1Z2KYY6_9ACTN|nr:3-oxoacyl-ACP synthase [Streptomyces albireticuli]